jgi:ZIP family zinc transporter
MQEPSGLFWQGSLASLLAGLGTSVGALWVLALPRPSPKMEDALLSVAAGVMLAATFVSLLLPAIEHAEAQASEILHLAIVLTGLFVGAGALAFLHGRTPHEHFVLGREGPEAAALRRVWLLIIAITLHNFPEGMAVGVGFAGTSSANAMSLAIGIGLQNAPEGLAVAGSMIAAGYARAHAFWVASLTGLVEPVGGAFGAAAVWLAAPLMPWMLGFAAGAMLFVISDEIIPETHRAGYEHVATFALLAGFALMIFLNAAFT